MGFDEFFGRIVRLTGYAIAVGYSVTGKLSGAEIVGLALAMIGFEFVVRARNGNKVKLNGGTG